MKAEITNHDIPAWTWEQNFTTDQLRDLARRKNIMRGRYKRDTAFNLSLGRTLDGTVVTFPVKIHIPTQLP